ncbi:pupal cuticle protein 36-like isoform X1 [Helicoverpa armigera]|uniref:pupal cuticle protein 36-like isoform X1 n=1 Tax=Helicoverpa armigera TaxID=29058 RepID=UPI003082BC2F
MKLFVIAALVAVAAGARLEHLERAYLPPFGANGGSAQLGSQGSFGGNSGAFGAAGADQSGAFAGATSNQYLPPDHGPSGSNGAPQFAGSLQGFGGAQNYRSQQYSGQQQYSAPSSQYSAPSSQYSAPSSQYSAPSSQFGSQAQFGQQAAASRQYLAPQASSQQYPQQAFDEETGYHY